MRAVKEGQDITEQTVGTFGLIVENIEQSRKDVDISQNTKEVSSNMADITNNLLEMIEA